ANRNQTFPEVNPQPGGTNVTSLEYRNQTFPEVNPQPVDLHGLDGLIVTKLSPRSIERTNVGKLQHDGRSNA
ncbi:MAG: hypothetical protein N2644_06040, partial [Candidatus Sumerlaea chitinivorans]|nr:hypothetical protein [Candidatus Sumerlaea chitinivorans]